MPHDERSIYGIAGFPLGHSFSKRYFTEKFQREGISAEFMNFEIENIRSMTDILQTNPRIAGFTVTIPHKQSVMELLDRISREAEEIGAVNCVKVRRQRETIELEGYNTDVLGFRNSLLEFIPTQIRRALVLGNGGAAKAVRYVLSGLGMEVVTVSRTPQGDGEIGYGEIAPLLSSTPLIVNTTPLGTFPHIAGHPDLPYPLLTAQHYLFDLVYNPETTEFMKRGAAAGAHTCNGLKMLHEQAEEAWRIWQNNEIEIG